MAARTFAQINCSILRSRKLRGLDHADRWVYLCTHLTAQATFTGIFTYPKALWAVEASLDQKELEDAIVRLDAVGLIEWSPEEELVRVVGVHRQRPPENASRVVGLIEDFFDLLGSVEDEGMVLRALAELVIASVTRAQNWNPEKGEFEKLRTALGEFLRRAYQEYDDDLLAALSDEIARSNKAAKAELGSLLPPLTLYQQDTVSTPSAHPADTRDLDETRLRQDEDQDLDETKTSEMLRNGNKNGGKSQALPTESTKRSALVVGMKG